MTFREFLDVFRGYRAPHLFLIDHRRRWFVFSGVLVFLSLVGLFGAQLNFSIDFEGGAQITYELRTEATAEDVQAMLDDAGLDGEVQIVDETVVTIRSESLTDVEGSADVLDALAEQAGVTLQDINIEDVGPTWGAEISGKALRGLVIVILAISAYIALRFEWEMAAGAMVALVHDVIITAGIYALTGREITPETVIAILTILGFSLYDTVVIYDRVKENTESPALMARLGYAGVVNHSLNQVLMRSVNTSLVVLLPILSLLLFGGETLKDFAFAMFIGTGIGAYSSIFIAAPLLIVVRRGRQDPAGPLSRPVQQQVARAQRADDAAAVSATARTQPSRAPSKKKKKPAKRKRR